MAPARPNFPDRVCKDTPAYAALYRDTPASPETPAILASPRASMRENARRMRDFARADSGPNPRGR